MARKDMNARCILIVEDKEVEKRMNVTGVNVTGVNVTGNADILLLLLLLL